MTTLPDVPTDRMVMTALGRACLVTRESVTAAHGADRTSRARVYAFLALAELWPDRLDDIAAALGASLKGSLRGVRPGQQKPAWWHPPYAVAVRKALDACVGQWQAAQLRRQAGHVTRAEKAEAEATRRAAEAKAAAEQAAREEREKARAAAEAELKRQADVARRAHDEALRQGQDAARVAVVRTTPAVERRYTRAAMETVRRGGVPAPPRADWWNPAGVAPREARRSVTAELCGDPAPGRSALDQRRAAT